MQLDADGDLVVPRRDRLPPPQDRGRAGPEELVLSEVHLESQPPAAGAAAVTAFCTAQGELVVELQHSMATPLRSVGLQVWRGALLLADLILHRGAAAFAGCTALELGAGAGLAGLVLSRLASAVYLTDVGAEVLANCQANAERHLQRHSGSSGSSSSSKAPGQVLVRWLDWLDPPSWLLQAPSLHSSANGSAAGAAPHDQQPPPQQQPEAAPGDAFAWGPADLRALQRLDWLLAADSVYDDVLTEGFMHSAVLLMRYARRHSGRSPRLLVALERRICFTLADLDVRAPAYDCWRRLFHAAGEETAAQAAGGACGPGGSAAGRRGGRAGERQAAPPPPLPLVGRRIDVGGVPQRLHPYQRTAYLELWELQLQEDAAR